MKFREVLICSSLAALTALLITATAFVCIATEVVSRLPQEINGAILETRAQVLGQLADLEHDTLKHLTALEAKADGRLGSIQADVTQQLARTVDTANAQLTGTLGRVDAALAEVHQLRSDVGPILAHATNITAHADEATTILFRRDALPAQILGVLGATKVTMGETAQTMRDIQRAAPQMIGGVDRIVANSDRTSAASAKLMSNLAEASKPLPRWLRWPLAITGAVAPSVGGVLAGAAAAGAFR